MENGDKGDAIARGPRFECGEGVRGLFRPRAASTTTGDLMEEQVQRKALGPFVYKNVFLRRTYAPMEELKSLIP